MVHTERVRLGGFTLWLLLVVFAFWGGEAQGRRDGAEARGRGRVHAAAGASQALTPALRAAYLSARQAEGGAGYAVREGEGGLLADNPAQGFRVTFSEQGVALTGAGAPRAGLTPVRFGCAGQMREVGRARPELREGRVAFPREGFVEWYVNGPLGLEQGFDVEEPPRCAGAPAETLEVELGLGEGLSASLEAGGEQIALRDGAGQRVLGLSELYAIDAKGNVLPARLGVTEAHGVSMRVETAGAEYPLVIDPLVWKEQQQLFPSDVVDQKYFGFSVAISGDTALIGAFGDDAQGVFAGAAYVFVRKGTSWSQQAKLLPSKGAEQAYFGDSVAISGDIAIVGEDGNSEKGDQAGAAYVFVRQGSTWSQQAKLFASDGAAGDYFGSPAAISGDTALFGAFGNSEKGDHVGAAYVFVRQGVTWIQQAKLLPSDGAAGDGFGWSAALSGDTALVGNFLDKKKRSDSGAAYVFVRKGTSWSQQAKLLASDTSALDRFGYAVALSGDTALVGAYGNDAKGDDAGAAYVFLRQGTSWSQQARLLASDAKAAETFGIAVALSGDTALVDAYSSVTKTGAAYVFLRQGGSWSQQTKLLPSNGAADDRFGLEVALEGDTAIVTASQSDTQVFLGGTAYAFMLTEVGCSKDTDCPAPPPGDCALAVCNTAMGTCGTKPKPDGVVCPGGICFAGGCIAAPTSSTSSTTSASSSAGAGGAGGADAGGADKDPGEVYIDGCACSTRGAPRLDAFGLCAMLLLGLVPLARRSARRRA